MVRTKYNPEGKDNMAMTTTIIFVGSQNLLTSTDNIVTGFNGDCVDIDT